MLAGNNNIHESLDEIEIHSDLIRDHIVIDVAPFSYFTVVIIPGK